MLLREAIAYDGKDEQSVDEILVECEKRGIAAETSAIACDSEADAAYNGVAVYDYDDFTQIWRNGEVVFTTWCEGEERIVKDGGRE